MLFVFTAVEDIFRPSIAKSVTFSKKIEIIYLRGKMIWERRLSKSTQTDKRKI